MPASGKCSLARFRQRRAREARRHIRQAMRRMRGIDEIGVQHQVIAHARNRDAMRVQRAHRRLQVMHCFGTDASSSSVFSRSPSADVSDSRSARPSSAETRNEMLSLCRRLPCALRCSISIQQRQVLQHRALLFHRLGLRSLTCSVSASRNVDIDSNGKSLSAPAEKNVAHCSSRRRSDQLRARGIHRGRKLLQQRRELQLGKQRARRGNVRLLRPHRIQLELHRHAAVDRHQLLAQQDVVAVVFQRLAIASFASLPRRGPALPRRCRTAGSTPPIPCRRSPARLECCRPSRRAAPSRRSPAPAARPASRSTFAAVQHQVVLHRIQHQHLLGHQLQHVLVVGDDEHLDARRSAALCDQRADHIVGLKSLRTE